MYSIYVRHVACRSRLGIIRLPSGRREHLESIFPVHPYLTLAVAGVECVLDIGDWLNKKATGGSACSRVPMC